MEHILTEVKKLFDPYVGLVLALVLIIILAIMFKEQLKELIPRINEIVFKAKNSGFTIRFDKAVKEAEVETKDIFKEDIETSEVVSGTEHYNDVGSLTAREIVLEAWGALKQTILNSCSALQIAMTPATRLNTAVDRLVGAKAIDETLANAIKKLHALGQEMANNIKLRPTIESAFNYKIISDNLVDWMDLYILFQSQGKPAGDEQKTSRRATLVGSYKPEPRPAESPATLVGLDGSVAGKRYKITKDIFKIGRNEDNDICIAEDEFVSGNHAFLSYQGENLFLSDQNSHNGTYLNGKKIAVPLMVHQNDKIRVGNSVFKVT